MKSSTHIQEDQDDVPIRVDKILSYIVSSKKTDADIKYQKCCMQLAAYDIAIEHTLGIKPDIHMIIVATVERPQVFAIQGKTISKYKEKWMKCVDKYYEEFHNIPEIEMEVVDLDKLQG